MTNEISGIAVYWCKSCQKNHDLGATCPVDLFQADLAFIAGQGWCEYPVGSLENCDRSWFRWFAGEPGYQATDNRLQIQLRLWDWRKHGNTGWSFDISFHAEPPGNLGFMFLKVSGITDVKTIEPNIDRLLRAWRAVCKL